MKFYPQTIPTLSAMLQNLSMDANKIIDHMNYIKYKESINDHATISLIFLHTHYLFLNALPFSLFMFLLKHANNYNAFEFLYRG